MSAQFRNLFSLNVSFVLFTWLRKMLFAMTIDVDDVIALVVVLPSAGKHLMNFSLQVDDAVLVRPDDLQQRGVEEG